MSSSWSLTGRAWYTSMTSSGRRGRCRQCGRAMMTSTHASQPSCRHVATPRRWTPTWSLLRCHTRHNVPRRSRSKRLQAAPSRRRVRRSTTKDYRRFPSNHTSAHGSPSCALNLPTSNTLFQDFPVYRGSQRFCDNVYFGDRGHRLVAQHMFQEMRPLLNQKSS